VELAGVARAHGYVDVAPYKVHRWRADLLLPPISAPISPRVTAQLLALCQLRRETKSWDRLAILLWLDGYDIPVERVRAAVLAGLPRRQWRRLTEKRLDELDRLARAKGSAVVSRLGIGRVGRHVAGEAMAVVLFVAVGATRKLDDTAAGLVERIGFVPPRARHQAIDGVGPFLTEPAVTWLAPWARTFSSVNIRRVVDQATEADFLAARSRAWALVRGLPRAIYCLELLHGRNVFGLRLVVRLVPRVPQAGIVVALLAPRLHIARQLDSLEEAVSRDVERRELAIGAAEKYRSKHPEQVALMNAEGVMGLHRRGLIIPLTKDELGFDPSTWPSA
jgi:hypothetical protein